MRTLTPSSRLDSLKAARPLKRPKPLVMGIVNATPDSFYASSRGGLELGLRLLDEGADWLDVGGQSTRPGSEPVTLDEELARVMPVIEALSAKGAVVSIDTDKAEVARRAREAGATILNDVTALRGDPGMMAEALKYEKVILMHMRGTPKTMQDDPAYGDVVQEVKNFLRERVSEFVRSGGSEAAVYADPGIGFGKTLEQNLSLIKHAGEFAEVAPVVIGVSRKSFFSKITPDRGPEDRLEGSLAVAVLAAAAGAAAVRCHDVAATRRALALAAAVQEAF